MFGATIKPKRTKESPQVSAASLSAEHEKSYGQPHSFRKKVIFVRLLGLPVASRLLGGWPILLEIQAFYIIILLQDHHNSIIIHFPYLITQKDCLL